MLSGSVKGKVYNTGRYRQERMLEVIDEDYVILDGCDEDGFVQVQGCYKDNPGKTLWKGRQEEQMKAKTEVYG